MAGIFNRPKITRGPVPTLRFPPPMPGIHAVKENLNDAAESLIYNKNSWNKDQCSENIRVAELFIAMAKEKLEKL